VKPSLSRKRLTLCTRMQHRSDCTKTVQWHRKTQAQSAFFSALHRSALGRQPDALRNLFCFAMVTRACPKLVRESSRLIACLFRVKTFNIDDFKILPVFTRKAVGRPRDLRGTVSGKAAGDFLVGRTLQRERKRASGRPGYAVGSSGEDPDSGIGSRMRGATGFSNWTQSKKSSTCSGFTGDRFDQ
jgi:hypothetical protein